MNNDVNISDQAVSGDLIVNNELGRMMEVVIMTKLEVLTWYVTD
jgi:hypothetical protein